MAFGLVGGLGLLVACGSEDGSQFVAPDPPEEQAQVPTPTGATPVVEAPLPAACQTAETVAMATPETANVLFLVDRSGSMQIKLSTGATRWTSTVKGLEDLLGSLKSNVHAGALMFPQGDKPITCCSIDPKANDVTCNCAAGELPGTINRCDSTKYQVPVMTEALDAAQVGDILAYVHSSDKEFYWGTPLEDGLKSAIDAQKASKSLGTKSVILLTDGNPTSCESTADPKANDIARVVQAATDGTKAGIRTFVLGVIDGTKGARAENLSPIAKAGGTARSMTCDADNTCFYPINANNFAADIKSAFSQIALQAFDCSFKMPDTAGKPVDLARMSVQVVGGGVPSTVTHDPGKKEGWEFLPGDQQIQLYGAACETMRKEAGAQVKIFLGCDTAAAK